MADIFDEIAGNVQTSAPVAASTVQPDIFDQVAASVSAPHSELRGVANAGLQGVSSLLGLADQFNPIRPEPGNYNPFGVPPLFGLFKNENEAPIGQVFDDVTKAYGVQTEDKPQTQLGKLAGNVLENAVAAAPFGPAAMAGNAVFGGGGGYLGEAAFGDKGRAIGSLVGGLSPAGISKLGIVKELGEQLGPTVSQFPVFREIFKDAPVKAAVGRALTKASDDPAALEKTLEQVTSTMGPQTQLNSLKTTGELAGDSGILRAEDAVQNMLPNAPFKNMATERAGVRAGEILKGYDPTATAYDTSKALEQKISSSVGNIEKVENLAWKALPKDESIAVGLKDNLQGVLDDITYSGALPIEGEAAGLLKKFNSATSEGDVSLGVIQDLRSRALQVARDTAGGTSAADRVGNKVASALASHLDDLVDSNVNAGLLSGEAADTWRTARQITKGKINTFGAPKIGSENLGTRSLEQLALKGQPLDNVTLLKEGLNSPDKLVSHIQAAAAGGQDVKPLYQQALKAELDGAPQSKWADIIDRKRTQWETVFSPDEMANLDRNLADVQAELIKNKLSTTTNSATNARGNVQRVLNSEKGLANLVNASKGAPALAGAYLGAKKGWNESDTTVGGIGNALLYGSIGALTGKAISNSAAAASDNFDALLTSALKNPAEALEAIQAAKPSDLGKALQSATMGAAKGTATKAAGSALNSLMGRVFSEAKSLQPQIPENNQEIKKQESSSLLQPTSSKAKNEYSFMNTMFKGDKMDKVPVEIMQEIKANPIDEAVMLAESNGNPKAKNEDSSASGLFQLVSKTAKSLGVKDVFDPADNFKGYKKLRDENIARFGDDPVAIYSSHYLGAPVLAKVLAGKPLTDSEAAQVKYLKEKALPRFLKIYKGLIESKDITEV